MIEIKKKKKKKQVMTLRERIIGFFFITKNDKLMMPKIVLDTSILIVISVYAP